MIEPTESENKRRSLDRFCDAMISIREEVENSSKDDEDNILENSPHTLAMITADEWTFPYSRKKAAFPFLLRLFELKVILGGTTRRVDEAYGDRNLMCSCAPVEEYV